MNIDATFWVAVSFFIFLGALIYFKIPQKVNSSLTGKINQIKKELEESEKLKNEARNLLSDYEKKIEKQKKDYRKIIDSAKKESEKNVIEKTNRFHKVMDERKKGTEQKIHQMKENALKDIKIASIKISIEAVEKLIKNSLDKNKLDNLYSRSLEQTKISLKKIKA